MTTSRSRANLKLVPNKEPAKFRQLGEKAYEFAYRHPADDPRITLLEGAVRSSKTWAMIPKTIQLCRYDVGGVGLILGVSQGSIYTNVLSDLFDVIGPGNYRMNKQTGELHLFGSWWRVMGANDAGAEKYIRGATVGKAIVDEASKMHESFWNMLTTRLSPPGARMYATTNPDSPQHYLKKKWMENGELIAAGDFRSIHFDLDDNPWLDRKYRTFLQASHKGVFFLRYVKGLWVMAEGAIYRDCWSDDLVYNDTKHPEIVRMRSPRGCENRWVACDYGTVHPHVYLDILDDGTDVWVDREYVWDSTVEMRQKTDEQYADDLEEFLKETHGCMVIVPPECASFKAVLAQRGIWHRDADNDVLDGIRMVSSMMSLKRLHIHERCVRLLKGLKTYRWNEKSALHGVEEPIKAQDDEADCLRYALFTMIKPFRLEMARAA